MEAVINFLGNSKEVIALVLFVFMAINSQAKAAVAATSEIMQKSKSMTDEAALELAATLLGKLAWLSWMPIGIRKWIVQMIFDGIKKVATKNA
jgi:hypothetical protein